MADADQATWGLVPKEVLERIVVVSPHFDDAVLGASDVLGTYPGSTVITLVAGWPPEYPAEATDWDACGGFKAGDDVVAARRKEDVGGPRDPRCQTTRGWMSRITSTWQEGSPDSGRGRALAQEGDLRPRIRRPCSYRWGSPTPTMCSPTTPGLIARFELQQEGEEGSGIVGSATRTTATSTSPVSWPGG